MQKGYRVSVIHLRPESGAGFEKQDERLGPVFAFIKNHPSYALYQGVGIKDIYGYAGDYYLELILPEGPVTVAVGAIIMADSEDPDIVRDIRPLLHIDIDDQGLFRSRNRDTMKAYTSEDGVFIACNYPSDLGRTVEASDSAVLAVAELLERSEILHQIKVSEVNASLCGGCGTCVKTCLFHACKIDPVAKTSVIDGKRCKGCGSCVTACPAGARDLLTYPQKYLFKAIDILSRYQSEEKKIILFLCEGCGYQAMDAAGLQGASYPVGAMPLKVRCGGTIDTQMILQAYKKGFDGVVICKCQSGHCSNIVGNLDLDRRANLFREILRSRGIDTERMRIVDCIQVEGNNCVQVLKELYQYLEKAGGEPVE